MVQQKHAPSSEARQPNVVAMCSCTAFKYSPSLSVLTCKVGMILPAIPGGYENQMGPPGTEPDTPHKRLSIAFHSLPFQMEGMG